MEPRVVRCPKCGYTWRTKSRKLYLTCPNCHRKFKNPFYHNDKATTTTATTTETTTNVLGTTERVRELARLPGGYRVLEVVVGGRRFRLVCTADLGACDFVEGPEGVDAPVIAEVMGAVYGRRLELLERSSGGGVEVLLFGDKR